MLSAYVNASDMDGAEKFFRRIKEDGLKPNVVVYGTLMKGYAKLNNLEKVTRVYERMRLQGVEANQTIYTTIMDAHGKNSDFGSAVIWFKEMSAHGLPPDQKAKNILLSLAKTPEEQKEANELVGNPSVSLHDSPKDNQFTEFVGDDEHGEQLKAMYCEGLDETAVDVSNGSEQYSSSLIVSSEAAGRARLLAPARGRHGATAENGAFSDRGAPRAASKKKDANCTPAISSLTLLLLGSPPPLRLCSPDSC
ncbi:hypothetical protein BHE74_00013466 [Ensete ventricosum]|nr:hypothetical protein BHE74_00013466 [Ensete ventricosum]